MSHVRHVSYLIEPRHVSQVRYVWFTERPARLSALANLAERALHVSMLERASMAATLGVTQVYKTILHWPRGTVQTLRGVFERPTQ